MTMFDLWVHSTPMRRKMDADMGDWECFKKEFEQGLQANQDPDGETNGPNSCMECLICLVLLAVMVIVLGIVYGILGIEPHVRLPWAPSGR